MSPTNFELSATSLNCSYPSPDKDLFTCYLEDTNGIQKQADHVSFLHVEPTTNYRSLLYYYHLDKPDMKIPVLAYEFDKPMSCKVLGTDKSTN